MDALKAFLAAELDVKKEVFIERLGVALEIKALDGKEIQQITEQSSFGGDTVDNFKFSALAVAKSCVNMNFGDAELLKKYGVNTADECVQKALLAGELGLLQKEIMEISGFKNPNEQVAEAKN